MDIASVSNTAPGNAITARQNSPESAYATLLQTEQPAKSAALTEQAPPALEEAPPSRLQLDEAVMSINDFVNSINKSLQFTVDDETGKTIVKVIDKETEQVIKQFPSEEMLAIAKALNRIKGLLVHQKA